MNTLGKSMSTKSTKHLPKFYLHFTYKYQQCVLSGNICYQEFNISAYYRFFKCDFVSDLIPICLYSTLCMSVIYLLRIMIDRWHRYDVMHDACNYGGLHVL